MSEEKLAHEERRERLRTAQDASIAELEGKFGALTQREKLILRFGFTDGVTHAYTIIKQSLPGVKA